MRWNRIEGRESKAFKMGSPAGLWGGCLKKGAWNLLASYCKGKFTCGVTWVIKFEQ